MKNVIVEVLAFLYGHWRREWRTVLVIAGSMIGATVADLFLPVFSGRLIDVIAQDAISHQGIGREQAFHAALAAVGAMTVLGAILISGRHLAFEGYLPTDRAAHVADGVRRFLESPAFFFRLAR